MVGLRHVSLGTTQIMDKRSDKLYLISDISSSYFFTMGLVSVRACIMHSIHARSIVSQPPLLCSQIEGKGGGPYLNAKYSQMVPSTTRFSIISRDFPASPYTIFIGTYNSRMRKTLFVFPCHFPWHEYANFIILHLIYTSKIRH